jgi:hypothetical protein
MTDIMMESEMLKVSSEVSDAIFHLFDLLEKEKVDVAFWVKGARFYINGESASDHPEQFTHVYISVAR